MSNVDEVIVSMWMGSQTGQQEGLFIGVVVWSSGGTVGQRPRSTFCGMGGQRWWKVNVAQAWITEDSCPIPIGNTYRYDL